LLLEGERWEEKFETLYFSTVDFLVSGDKVQLCEYDAEFWSDLYTPKQASFRYYDRLNDSIGFLTPRDLLVNHEIQLIADLTNKKEQEVMATLIHWLSYRNERFPLYLNDVGTTSFDLPQPFYHTIEFVY
jgi:hypothetical protein